VLVVVVAALMAWSLRLQTQVNARVPSPPRAAESEQDDELMQREVIAWERVADALTRIALAMNPPRSAQSSEGDQRP